MKSKISIIGCGWLGYGLAKHFISKGHKINGSTSTKSKMPDLHSAGINPFLLKISPEKIDGNLRACLEDCETLILNIPPGLRKNPEKNYVDMMSQLLPIIEQSYIEQLLFIGSTSVYEDKLAIPVITETSEPATSKVSKKLLEVEQLFFTNTKFKCTLLRFGGLIGFDRHPAKYLSGKTDLKNPDAPVNLIHRNDCISIIDSIIETECWGNVFNATNPFHPTSKSYYSKICKALDIELPLFDQNSESKGKIINSGKLAQQLSYCFKEEL